MHRFKDSTTGSAVVSKDAKELQVVDVDFVILVDVRVASAAAVTWPNSPGRNSRSSTEMTWSPLMSPKQPESSHSSGMPLPSECGCRRWRCRRCPRRRCCCSRRWPRSRSCSWHRPARYCPVRRGPGATPRSRRSSPARSRSGRAMRTPSRFEQSLAMNCWALPCSSSGSTYQVPLLTSSVPPFSNWVQLMPTSASEVV